MIQRLPLAARFRTMFRLGCSSSREAAFSLLERCGVASVPGAAFYSGPQGEDWLRFCFAKEDAELDEACARLERLGA